jgi:transposase, IS5 family
LRHPLQQPTCTHQDSYRSRPKPNFAAENVETDIHHPTDNTLLWDVVRVVTRLIGHLAKALEMRRIKGFRDRRRSARRRMYEIQRMTTRQRQGARQTATYRELIGIAEEEVASARTALDKTSKLHGKSLLAAMKIDALRKEIALYRGLGERVIDQARRRVLDGEQVPNAEKIYSIFEPHTDLIKRGKVRTSVEFGHEVFLAESAKGLITQYEVLGGNPADEVHVAPSLKRHRHAFRRAPELYAGDRGFFSEQNVTACVQGAVKTVCIPQRGGSRTPQRQACERSQPFKQGQRFRAGIEGRISVLMRGRGMKLPRRRHRALHIVCRRGSARQQPHDPCPTAQQTGLAPTKSRAITSDGHQCEWNKNRRVSSHLARLRDGCHFAAPPRG